MENDKNSLSIGKRLKKWRNAKGIKAKQLAEILKVAPGRISDYERDKISPSIDTIEKIIEHTDINRSWLLTGEGPMIVEEKKDTSPFKINVLELSTKKFQPIYEYIKNFDFIFVPAITNIWNKDKNSHDIFIVHDDCYFFRRDWLEKKIGEKFVDRLVVFNMNSDNMKPTLEPGDKILISIQNKMITNGIFLLNMVDNFNLLQVNRLINKGDSIEIISDNEKYHSFNIKIDQIRIIGKLIGFSRFLSG